MKLAACLLALLSLTGCATIMEGTAQSVTLSTTPTGAECEVDRAGTHIGTVAATPGSLHLDKSKNDLTVTCSKVGYQQATTSTSPKFVATTFGNILIGGVVGVVVDAADGANYKYPDEIHLDLVPVIPATATAPTIEQGTQSPLSPPTS